MWIFVITVLVVIAAVAVHLHQRFANILHYASKLPGPKAYPLIGNSGRFVGKTPAGFLQELQKLVDEWGKCFRIWQATDLMIIVSDAEIAETILSSQKYLEKSVEYDFTRPWLGDGLLNSSGRKWHSRRKIITPTFHFKIMEQFADIFDRHGAILVEQLKSKSCDGSPVFDIYPYVTLYALDVICESAMGTKMDAQIKSDSEYVRAVKNMAYVVVQRIFKMFARLNFTFKFTSSYRIQKKALQVLHGYTDNVIRSRRQELTQSSGTSNQNDQGNDVGARKKVAFLDMLLHATIDGQPLPDLDIREEVDTFMFEGHDTTTSAICFLLQNLAKNPEVQQKVYEEIRSVIGDDLSKPVTLSMLNELNYLDLVIKESLRLYPSVPMFGRKMLENIDINGTIYPAGASVMFVPYFMCRDPDYFENPLGFRPERFAVETSAEKTNPFRYIPFSAGPRNCIGQKYAVAEVKSLISKVLQYYEVLPAIPEQPERLYFEMILRSENGVPLRLKKRVQ